VGECRARRGERSTGDGRQGGRKQNFASHCENPDTGLCRRPCSPAGAGFAAENQS
jgi:hypothetical protein